MPGTPGRQLPKPNPNHRSAKALRNNRMKRTSSAEYGENEMFDNYYIRTGKIINIIKVMSKKLIPITKLSAGPVLY